MKKLWSAVVFGLPVALAAARSDGGFTTFEVGAVDVAGITPTRDAFRTAVGGGTTAGANGSFGGVRREINWDGVPDAQADPNPLLANFFNTTSPRGVVLSTPGTGFLVSANAGGATPPMFGFPNDFVPFSPQRMFTAVNSNITDVTFFVPGTTTPATTSAFGVVFTDVEVRGVANVQFFDVNNAMIYSRDVPISSNQGLEFSGALANAGEKISRVRITSGANTIVSNGVLGDTAPDAAVMDDFIFAEPTAVPEPTAVALIGLAPCLVMAARRRRHGWNELSS
jgi:hypothetical protein